MNYDQLVTVASFIDPTEASLARNLLEAEGIAVYLADENTVSMAWQLGGAVGGIKLQVATRDFEHAESILHYHPPLPGPEPFESHYISETPLPAVDLTADDEESERVSSRGQYAEKAVRCAIFGIIFLPLLFYAFWLVLKTITSEGELTGRQRLCWLGAALISGPAMTFFIAILFVPGLLSNTLSTSTPSDLQRVNHFPRPDVLVGIWEHRSQREKGEFVDRFELNSNGNFSEVTDLAGTKAESGGRWSFGDEGIYLYYRRGSRAAQNARLVHLRMEPLRNDELILHFSDDTVLFRRQ